MESPIVRCCNLGMTGPTWPISGTEWVTCSTISTTSISMGSSSSVWGWINSAQRETVPKPSSDGSLRSHSCSWTVLLIQPWYISGPWDNRGYKFLYITYWVSKNIDFIVQLLSCVRIFATDEQQLTRLPCPSPSLRVCSNSCPLSQWCHPTMSNSAAPFSSCPQFPQYQGLFQWVGSLHQVVKVLELQHQPFQWIFTINFL